MRLILVRETLLGFVLPVGAILVSSKSDDAIEAWVTLVEQHMAAFEQDPNVIEFVSIGSSYKYI